MGNPNTTQGQPNQSQYLQLLSTIKNSNQTDVQNMLKQNPSMMATLIKQNSQQQQQQQTQTQQSQVVQQQQVSLN